MLSSSLLAWIVILSSIHQVATLPYDGSECRGLFEFELSSNSDVVSLDGDVATDLSSFPVYISYRCKAALRNYYCLSTYTPEANNSSTTVCASVCQEVLSSCGGLLEQAAKASSLGLYLYNLFNLCADDLPQTECVSGTGAYFSQDEPQCFYETVVPDEHGASFLLDPSACAIPCPGNVFHHMYPTWHRLFFVLSIVSMVGASVTTFSFARKYWRQRRQRWANHLGCSSLRTASVFPVLMFCVGGWIQSVVNCIALLLETFQPTCEGNAKWRSATPMCFVQSVTILGACFWSCCWSFIMAFETWAIVFLAPNPSKRLTIRTWCASATVVVTILSVLVIHLTSTQVLEVDLPFCVLACSNGAAKIQDAVFWIPSTILVSLSTVMMFSVLFRVQKLDRNTNRVSVVDKAEHKHNTCSYLVSILTKVSKALFLRIFLLVLCYNCFFLFFSFLLYDEQLHAHKHKTNAADYYKCLFTYSMTDPEVGREHCGDISDWNISQPLWTFTIYVVIVGVFGLIPFLVFGADYECRSVACCIRNMESIGPGWSTNSKQSPKRSSNPHLQLANPHGLTIYAPVRHLEAPDTSGNTSVTPNDSPGDYSPKALSVANPNVV